MSFTKACQNNGTAWHHFGSTAQDWTRCQCGKRAAFQDASRKVVVIDAVPPLPAAPLEVAP